MSVSFRDYFQFLDSLGQELDALTEIAKEKTAAVRRDDLMAVNECMKKEQVISLSLRTMDKKRDAMRHELGIDDLPLSALADRCPEELRLEALECVDRLRKRYAIYQGTEQVARTTLEVNLHEIERIIAAREGGPAEQGSVADIRA